MKCTHNVRLHESLKHELDADDTEKPQKLKNQNLNDGNICTVHFANVRLSTVHEIRGKCNPTYFNQRTVLTETLLI